MTSRSQKQPAKRPVGRATLKKRASSRSKPSRKTTRSLSVMVVDDHPMWRRTLKQVLEEDGRARVVAEAADGEEALRLAGRAKPQVVVMDINLPGLDGTEATPATAEEPPGYQGPRTFRFGRKNRRGRGSPSRGVRLSPQNH